MERPTLAKLADSAQHWEISQRCLGDLNGKGQKTSAFKATTASAPHHKAQSKGNQQKKNNNNNNKGQVNSNSTKVYKCYRCGHSDAAHDCKAVKATCKYCGKVGHYAGVCNKKKNDSNKPRANLTETESKDEVQASSNAVETA